MSTFGEYDQLSHQPGAAYVQFELANSESYSTDRTMHA